MAVTAAQFKTRLTSFAEFSNDRVELFLAEAARNISASQASTAYDDMQTYLAAHLLVLAERGEAMSSGPVASKSPGRGSVSFTSSPTVRNSAYASTAYGLQFLNLIRATVVTRVL